MLTFLLGPPCAGKTTCSELLKEKFGYSVIGIGKLLRERAETDMDLRELLSQGKPADETTTSEIARHAVSQALQENKSMIVVDGYPRTVEQMRTVDSWPYDKRVVFLNASSEICVARMLKRKQEQNRMDDNRASMNTRQEFFHTETLKVLEKMSDRMPVFYIDSNHGVEEVFDSLCKVLDKQW